ncbi:MAG: dihydroxyacetone kinase subunit DhaL [Actinobacteria bacterium]|nr:dihydroxyacetone kinase subunit DhaL [Actinomycetota bacterium]MCL5070680.1 dihydroxyacetone kinase subunit DhaL [Actinomycetota bacterium]
MQKNNITLEDFKNIFIKIRDDIEMNVKYLCELDSVIGDGDHGTTISKGFNNAIKQVEINKPDNIRDLFISVGNSIIDSVGGVTGIVFGSMFKSMGEAISQAAIAIGIDGLIAMFENSLETSLTIGKGAKPGEKTMVDSLYPAVLSLKKSYGEKKPLKEILEEMSLAANKGALSTKDMIATKGRARYLGERSLGFQDPGATSIAIIIKAFSIVFK